jgi:hypothetical protein
MEARDLTLLGGAVTVLVVAVVVLVVLLARARRLAAAERAAARGEAARLSARVEELSRRLEDLTHAAEESRTTSGPETERLPAEFVITRAGEPEPDLAVPDRLVLSATVGEPLIRVAAFAHGVRRALAAESRNRIFFEMRREVRRSRKQRRRDVREALRRMQADQRAQDAA